MKRWLPQRMLAVDVIDRREQGVIACRRYRLAMLVATIVHLNRSSEA